MEIDERIARRIRHQIGEAAFERGRSHGDDRLAVEYDRRLVAGALGVGFNSSRNAAMSVGAEGSPKSPRAKAR